MDDVARLRSKIGETYFGILTLHREHEQWLLPLYRYLELPPILVQCHAPRGHGGRAINSITALRVPRHCKARCLKHS